jgi:hypothetical protein
MSRSNPSDSSYSNPATRKFEWNGEKGLIRYYDKEAKANVDVGTDFTFILLDQLGSVTGWHDASTSGIYSNEVKSSLKEPMVVKAFKGGVLAEGFYKDIKERVNKLGGQYAANCYIAFTGDDGAQALGSLKLKGAALSAWMEFTKANRASLYKARVHITGVTEGKKGRVTFRMPVFSLEDVPPVLDAEALALDETLQEFFDAYFKRTPDDTPPDDEPPQTADVDDDSIPF